MLLLHSYICFRFHSFLCLLYFIRIIAFFAFVLIQLNYIPRCLYDWLFVFEKTYITGTKLFKFMLIIMEININVR